MKSSAVLSISLGAIAGLGAILVSADAQSPVKHTRYERFVPTRHAYPEGPARLAGNVELMRPAQTGFDNLTNGYAIQGPPFDKIDEDNVVPLRSFNDARFTFEEVEQFDEGLGPTYNTQSCRECHQNVVTGSSSQITEQRTGHTEDGQFFESLGGSLIQSRASYDDIVEHVVDADETRTFRLATNVLGNGYVECISDSTLTAIRDAQPEDMRGTTPEVPVLEGDGSARIGRFGWKCQHASLLSFAGDAYVNEMGVTSELFPDENTSNGKFVGFGTEYDPVPDPEPDGEDINAFALFMRSTKAPPRGEITEDVKTGEKNFTAVGCATCHVGTLLTAMPGEVINGGAFVVPGALGNRSIHPFSDFLLHDIGTGDGIPILPGPDYAGTEKQIRTAPLWGLRTRNRLMHDGLSFTKNDAIQRHDGQAANVTAAFNALTESQRSKIMMFLDSL